MPGMRKKNIIYPLFKEEKVVPKGDILTLAGRGTF
jgi:hypothetical protein